MHTDDAAPDPLGNKPPDARRNPTPGYEVPTSCCSEHTELRPTQEAIAEVEAIRRENDTPSFGWDENHCVPHNLMWQIPTSGSWHPPGEFPRGQNPGSSIFPTSRGVLKMRAWATMQTRSGSRLLPPQHVMFSQRDRATPTQQTRNTPPRSECALWRTHSSPEVQ